MFAAIKEIIIVKKYISYTAIPHYKKKTTTDITNKNKLYIFKLREVTTSRVSFSKLKNV